MRWQGLLFFQTHYSKIFEEEKAAWLEDWGNKSSTLWEIASWQGKGEFGLEGSGRKTGI